MESKHLQISFAAPPLVLDFLSFVYRITFVDNWKSHPNLINGFYRTSEFSIAAPLDSWIRLFTAMRDLDRGIYVNRCALLAFAIYLQSRNLHKDLHIDNMPDFVSGEDVPISISLVMSTGLFEQCMQDVTFSEISDSKFDIS